MCVLFFLIECVKTNKNTKNVVICFVFSCLAFRFFVCFPCCVKKVFSFEFLICFVLSNTKISKKNCMAMFLNLIFVPPNK